ncbi:uncharacterized protein WCC33_019335 [Rhinophrynus dorsalis]
MNKDGNRITEKILNITLEIIFLLTGEDYIIVKKQGDHETSGSGYLVSEGLSRTQNPTIEPSSNSSTDIKTRDQKIMKLTNKILHLLTGEVSVRCQDIAVSLSMEEWEFVEECRRLYKKNVRGSQQTISSTVKTAVSRTPERDHILPDLPDCVKEDNRVTRDNQIVQGDTILPQMHEEDISTEINSDESCDRKTPDKCHNPPDSEDDDMEEEDWMTQDNQNDSGKRIFPQQCKEEEIPIEISTDRTSNGETPEKCSDPSDSEDGDVEEEDWMTQDNQNDPGDGIFLQQCKEEEIPVKISTDERRDGKTPDKCHNPPDSEDDDMEEEDWMTQDNQNNLDDAIFPRQCKEEEIPIEISTASECAFNNIHVIQIDHIDEEEDLVSDGSSSESNYATDITKHEEINLTDSQSEHTGVEYPLPLTKKNLKRTKVQRIKEDLPDTEHKYRESARNITNELDSVSPQSTHSNKVFNCSEGQTCSTNNSDSTHPKPPAFQKDHKENKPHQCSECGKSFPSNSKLVRHQTLHTGEKPFQCPECGKCFSRSSTLAMHQRIHSEENPFQCSECGKSLSSKASLIVHQRLHTGEKPFQCSECRKCFPHIQGFARHQKYCIGKAIQFSESGEPFYTNSTLLNRPVSTETKIFQCPECGKFLSCRESLVRHQKTHTGIKPFKCSTCGKAFYTNATLVIHQRSHTGERPYTCPVCGKCFAKRENCITHLRSHTGEQPFECSDCGKRFTSKEALARHRKIHADVKQYQCPDCGKYFARTASFLAHKRTHTGEKPYACSKCGKTFCVSSNLIVHERMHERKPLSCTDCRKCFADKPSLVEHQKKMHGKLDFSDQNVGHASQ